MFPMLARMNVIDRGPRNIVGAREFGERDIAGSRSLSYGKNLFLGQFRVAMAFTKCMSLLSTHIGKIIELRTQEQMVGTATGRIIAMMADIKAVRNRAISQFVGNDWGMNATASFVHDAAITMTGMHIPYPGPASIWIGFVNLRPEALFNGNGMSTIGTSR